MTEIQEHILALVNEIDRACRENEIVYILHGQTAGCALKNGKFKTGAYPFHIIVPEKDIPKLVEGLSSAGYEDREIESPASNPGLRMNITRYVDSATCLYDRKEAVAYRCSGAAVTIHPFREKKAEGKGVKGILGSILGKKEPSAYELEMSAGVYRSFPAECLARTKRIPFETMYLPVSENSDLFFECFFGPDWQDLYAEEMQSTNSSYVIWDANRSYRQYQEDFRRMSVDMAELFGKIRAYDEFLDTEYEAKRARMLRSWTIAKRSEDKIALSRVYAGKMDLLRKLAAEDNLAQLKEEMAPYLEKEDLYRTEGLDFHISDELLGFARQARRAEGK